MDPNYFKDPRNMAMMGIASELLRAGGDNPRKINISEALGRGIQSGMGAYNQGRQMEVFDQQMQRNKMMQEMQQQEMLRKFQMQNMLAQRFGMGGQGVPPPPPGMPGPGDIPPDVPRVGGMQPGVGMPPQPGGGQFPLSLNDAAAISAMGGPNMLEHVKFAQQGVKREAGSYYTDPSTGQERYMPRVPEGATIGPGGMSAIPGAAGVNAQFKGAEAGAVEAAKARLDPVTVFDPSTRQNVMIPRLQAVGGGGGGIGGGGVGQSAQPNNRQVIASQHPSDVLYGNKLATTAADDYQAIQTAGAKSSQTIADFERVGDLLSGVRGGSMAGVKKSVASLAHSLGIEVDPRLGDKEAAEALVVKLAIGMREAGSGPMSDKDFDNFLRITPQLQSTEQGRQKIIETATKKAQRDADVAERARMWNQRFGRLDAVNPDTGMDFRSSLEKWIAENPVFGE